MFITNNFDLMESLHAVDLRVLQYSNSSSPPSDETNQDGSSGHSREPVPSDDGSSRHIDAESAISSENDHPILPPNPDAVGFEDFLLNHAYSDNRIRQLYYNYKSFKDMPGFELFTSLLAIRRLEGNSS